MAQGIWGTGILARKFTGIGAGWVCALLSGPLANLTTCALASDLSLVGQIPDEYESTSGHGIAMNNAGYASNDGASAIRANPALLALQKQYTVTAGYHWPTVGRDYYQAAVVDSQTSPVAAGVSYTGFSTDYEYFRENNQASLYDSPLIRRGALGVAQSFGRLALGVGGVFVESRPTWSDRVRQTREDQNIRGVGLNLGLAAPLSTELSLGASVENVSNNKIKEYAPRTIRAGMAYSFTKMVVGFLDLRQRDRVAAFESSKKIDPDQVESPSTPDALAPERLVIASFSAHLQDVLRLVGSYAQSLTDDRRSLAGGLAVVSKNFSLSYTVAQPYMKLRTAHQAVTLSLDMAM
jgi:hypothetical protein